MSSPQHEPTMEEILASIRKIISEDAPAGEATPGELLEPAAQAPDIIQSPTIAPSPVILQSDVLELTQEIVEPAAPPIPSPVSYEPPKPENDVVFQPMEESVSQSGGDQPHDGIFSDQTRKAMDDAFAGIPEEAPEPAPRPAPQPFAPTSGATVEGVFERAVRESFEPVLQKYLADNSGAVIERMKPLIREWMDEHFPALLEGAVRAEVERVVKARGAKR